MNRFIIPFFVLVSFFFAGSLFAETQPGYVLEAPDIITVDVKSQEISTDALKKINGTHLISPDGSITLGEQFRFHVQDLTVTECELAILAELKKRFPLDSTSMEIKVDVYSYNSKEYYVQFLSEAGGEQKMAFPTTGNDSVIKTMNNCGDPGTMLPTGMSKQLLVLRSNKPGKPVQIISVDFEAAIADPKKDVAIQSGDVILVRQELLSDHKSESVKSSKKRIARSVYFDGEKFPVEQLLVEDIISLEQGILRSLIRQIQPNSSISILYNDEGFSLIFFGEEETVKELYRVFKKIANGTKKIGENHLNLENINDLK